MNPLHLRFSPIDNKMKTKMMKKQKMTNTKPWIETQNPISEHPKMKKEKVEEGSCSGFIIRSGFTEMDEIIILQCMIEYAKTKNVPLPLASLRSFYPFLKGKLSADFTNSQIYDKIRRLKGRYLNRLKKESGGGAPVLTFSSDHDFEVYAISKNIWAVDSNDDAHDEEDGEQVFCSKYPLLVESLEWENSSTFSKLDTVKENLHLIGSAKASELEMDWMELKSKESEIHSRKVNFKMELIRTVLNATKDGGLGASADAM